MCPSGVTCLPADCMLFWTAVPLFQWGSSTHVGLEQSEPHHHHLIEHWLVLAMIWLKNCWITHSLTPLQGHIFSHFLWFHTLRSVGIFLLWSSSYWWQNYVHDNSYRSNCSIRLTISSFLFLYSEMMTSIFVDLLFYICTKKVSVTLSKVIS